MAVLYADVNEAKLQEDASSSLLTFGAEFHPDIITGANGVYIYTASGHRMLDWTSGQMSCLIGHGNPEIVEVITKHAKSLDHLFSAMVSPPVISLAKRITSVAPPGLDKALFLSTGAESNEAAIRLAKFYTGKFEIVGLSASWHGMTGAAIGVQYKEGRAGYGPLIPGNLVLPAPNAYRSIFPQTAIGRAGDMFAFQHDGDGFVPDILTLSKTLGNGLPLSAAVTSNKIAHFVQEKGFSLYTTHLNDPLPAAVGDKVLEIVIRDGLVERSRQLGNILQAGLRRLEQRYGCIGDVRGRGLMAGVEIVLDRTTKEPGLELGHNIAEKMVELGLWAKLGTQQRFSGVFRIAPPITIEEADLKSGLDIMEKAFALTPGTLPLYER